MVKQTAQSLGQSGLSRPDLDVLALALQLSNTDEVLILSDDFALRNIAHELEIKSKGITTKGGTQKRSYGYQCSACGARYFGVVTECEICGHTIFDRFRRS
jgi:rRNA maturation endonuclease Nob1